MPFKPSFLQQGMAKRHRNLDAALLKVRYTERLLRVDFTARSTGTAPSAGIKNNRPITRQGNNFVNNLQSLPAISCIPNQNSLHGYPATRKRYILPQPPVLSLNTIRMKLLLLSFYCAIRVYAPSWLTDFDEAQKIAEKNHQWIVLNFSGSDWCGPCIRMHKEIFDSEAFRLFADHQLVLVNADFPRLKKNKLSPAQQKHNDALAEKYNASGAFPCTLLLDARGNIIKRWEGYPAKGSEAFVAEIKQALDDNR